MHQNHANIFRRFIHDCKGCSQWTRNKQEFALKGCVQDDHNAHSGYVSHWIYFQNILQYYETN